ncbi:hypothetical protein GCM10011274_42500 [Paraglaciecola chathamensis]|uniref:Uncharacterized protein n=1 Tax=Paraglaciecola chathamensis TaxID=368405 RepID=A0A8H9IKB8_9ALTE|nr:hypothetical protein GCM10011274_42500 [Paraglaciecola oceanifecundans]
MNDLNEIFVTPANAFVTKLFPNGSNLIVIVLRNGERNRNVSIVFTRASK